MSRSVSSVSPTVEKATRLWNRLLESRPDAVIETRERIREGIRERGLLYGDRALSTFLRPRFIDAEQWKQARSMASHFHAVLSRLMNVIRHDDVLLEDLGIRGRVRDLVHLSEADDEALWFMRLDGFLDRGTIRLVEFNADSPGGAAFVDVLGEVFESLPIFQEFRQTVPLWRRPSLPKMLECVQTAAALLPRRRSRGQNGPRVAILDWTDVNTAREFELIRDHFARQGVEAVIADPREAEVVKDRLVVGGKPIDIVLKRVLVTDLAERWDEVKPLLEALRRNLVLSLNPLACQAVTVKSLLALYHEGRLDRWLTPVARAAWERHLPWTVRVHEGRARKGRRSIDVMSYLGREQARLVLKPSDAWGAEGIVLGWRCTAGEWAGHLATALERGDYVAQERVDIPKEEYPEADDGTLRYRSLHVEISPYTWFPQTASDCLTRLSASDFLNIKTGGGVVTSYVLKDGVS